MTLKQVHSSPVWLSAHKRLGKLSILVEGKAGERMCFQGSPRSWGLAPQVRPPSLLPGPQFPGQGRVPPTPSEPCKHEPCKHISRWAQHCPWGRRLPECISTTAGRHAGVTQPRAPGTSHGRAMLGSPSWGRLAPPMGPRRRLAGGALACEKPKRRAQLALAEGSKQPREAFAGSCWPAPR